MKALVTGGAGFIGGHLSERLLASGHQVVVIDDLSTGDLANIAHLVGRADFEFVQGSILDTTLIDETMKRVDTVFHLAAAVGVELILERSLEGLRTNLHGTETVLESACRHGVRALVASTSEVYGKNPAVVLSEDIDRVLGSPLVRRWSYAEAKAMDETLAYLLWCEYGTPIVTARLFNVAGPRQTGRYGMVIPRFVRQALRGEPLTVYGDGLQTRSFCHVNDAVDGLIALVEHEAAHGRVVNIGRPEEVSVGQLAERVISLTGSSSTITRVSYEEAYGDGFEDTMRRVPDIARARELVGFAPRLDLDDIIRAVVDDQLAAMAAEATPAAVQAPVAVPIGVPDVG